MLVASLFMTGCNTSETHSVDSAKTATKTFPVPMAAGRIPAPATAMRTQHFVADGLSGSTGYTYTLPSRLGEILADAESKFGSRDTSYTILGIEFGPDNPRIWYPGNRRHIIVQLSQSALQDEGLAVYQLAHEAIHLLAPDGSNQALIVEEGLASVYAEDYVRTTFGRSIVADLESYREAASHVRLLLDADPECISRLRDQKPDMSSWTPDDFAQSCPLVNRGLAIWVTRPFVRSSE